MYFSSQKKYRYTIEVVKC